MLFTRPLEELGLKDIRVAGGKGASLGEMTQAGIPVPPGFVVLTPAFKEFLEISDLDVKIDSVLHSVDTEAMHTLEEASETIQRLIKEAHIPKEITEEIKRSFRELGAKFVAVRSSATAEDSKSAAWAGQLDTFLNVTQEDFLLRVQDCWASLFTPRAIFYRFEQGFHEDHIPVAVVVQKMVNSETSGVAFSVHPITGDRNQLIIEAGFGLGETIVSGQITPDSYVVGKEPRRIVDMNIAVQAKAFYCRNGGGNELVELERERAEAQVLTKEEILELSKLILKIEDHYGFPCDIEWASEKGRFYITQSRPITTLSKSKSSSIVLEKSYTREHSLFWSSVWNKGETEGLKKFLGQCFETVLFLREPNSEMVSVWYEPNEADNLYALVERKVEESQDFFRMAASEFNVHYRQLLPYFEHKKKITSVNELEVFHTSLVNWWPPMAIIYAIPSLTNLSKKIRNEALEIRKDFEQFSDADSLAYFINTYFPQYRDIASEMLPEEVFMLKDRSFSESEIAAIQDRKRGFGLLGGTLYGYDDLQKELKCRNIELKTNEIASEHEFSGSVAFPGIIKGVVRVLLSKNDSLNLKKGEILVTHMTSPDFVPAMKKAGAIVTDEGGITCHAAIVSRELEKPCVIGTKIATQVLKDGMEIEVDANKGVVRLLDG